MYVVCYFKVLNLTYEFMSHRFWINHFDFGVLVLNKCPNLSFVKNWIFLRLTGHHITVLLEPRDANKL